MSRISADLRAVVLGEEDGPVTPLSWLKHMIDACATLTAEETLGDEDPDAWRLMVEEVRALHDRLRAAVCDEEAA